MVTITMYVVSFPGHIRMMRGNEAEEVGSEVPGVLEALGMIL